jgi:hypothetical protein
MEEEQLNGKRIIKTPKPCFHDKVAGDTLKILFKAINPNYGGLHHAVLEERVI